MCFICDGGTPDELMRSIAGHIEQYGWHVSAVSDGVPGLGWAYTVGLTETFGHPELITTGMCCMECAHSTLNNVGEMVAAGSTFAPGDEVFDEGAVRARIGAVHERHWQSGRFNTWLEYYGGRPWDPPERLALQVLTLDRRGRWQDDRRNRRWPLDRLDRAPHTSVDGRRHLR